VLTYKTPLLMGVAIIGNICILKQPNNNDSLRFCILFQVNGNSMKAKKILLYGICMFLANSLFSQHSYELNTKYPVHNLQDELRIIADPDNRFTVEQIRNDATLNFISGSETPRYLEVGITYWAKINLISNKKLQGWKLHLQDVMIGLPAWGKSNGKVDVYAFVDGKQIFHKKTGVEYPKRERDVKTNWVMNQVSLDDLPINEVVTLVIKAKGNSIGYPSYFNLTARSPQQPFYHQIYQFHNSFNIFMFGVTFIIFLYHVLQFFYLRERVFMWFSIWLLFCTLTQAMTVGLIIGSVSKMRFVIWVIIANGIFYSFWFFGRSFIGSQKKFPLLDKFMLGLALFVSVEVVIVACYVMLFDPQIYLTGVGIHYALLSIYTACSLILSIILVLKKDRFATYFGIGSIIGSVFLILGTLWAMGIIKPLRNFPDPFSTAMFLQLVIYSFGIAYRQQVINKNTAEEKLQAQKNTAEMQRVKDLDKVKTRFFANISHEFRTPLSLIKGPLKQAKNRIKGNEESVILSNKAYQIIQNNTNRLQNLVEQLLDLSKIESGKVHLSLKQGGLIQFLRSVIFSFESMAERNNVALNTSFPPETNEAFYDKDKLEKIVSNIVSNAFKYTSKNGNVTVTIDYNEQFLTLEVADTGKGIDHKELKRIFDRFYRIEGNEERGSGIGLALTKELVELHNGKISVDSTKDVGTTFKVRLPITLQKLPQAISIIDKNVIAFNEDEVIDLKETDAISQSDISVQTANDFPVALIIEDNNDLRYFISEILKGHYSLLTSEDGLQGERMAFHHIPDIIISDIMMPKKDGYELCSTLKTNSKTSHIPIIMLTAKAGQEHKIEGLAQGADAYLTKPFDDQELLLRMKNLIDSRKKLWDHFKALDMLLVDDIKVSSIDDKFLQQVFKTIKNNLDNEQFNVEDIARDVGFSRSQLHRKLRAISDKSANQLIIEVRMNEAHRMLEQKAGTVSEIAYSVGYSNLSYFTKSFKSTFGKLPSKM